MNKNFLKLIIFFVCIFSFTFITGERLHAAYFYNASGQCAQYKSSVNDSGNYCVQAGAEIKQNANYYDCKLDTSCVDEAVAYYGKHNFDFYSAQSILNGRRYYKDSSCQTAYDTTEILKAANNYCYTYPSFVDVDSRSRIMEVGNQMTLTDSNGVLKDYSIRLDTPNLIVKKEGNTLRINAVNTLVKGEVQDYVKATIILEKGNTDAYVGKCSTTSQNYIISKDLPYVGRYLTIYIKKAGAEEEEEEKGSFTLYKYDALSDPNNLTPVEGACFYIGTSLNKNGEIANPILNEETGLNLFCSDSTGLVYKNDDISLGTTIYYQEHMSPIGYVPDTAIRSKYIKEGKNYVVRTFNIKKQEEVGIKTGLIIKKQDQFGNVVEGVVKYKVAIEMNPDNPTITRENVADYFDNSNCTNIVTDHCVTLSQFYQPNRPELITGLIPITNPMTESKYTIYLREICDSDIYGTESGKYVCDNNIYSYTVGDISQNSSDDENRIETIVLTNYKNIDKSLILQKTDENSGEGIKDVEFKVYNDTYEKTIKTDKNGFAYIYDMPDGEYYIKETKAASGYNLDDGTYSFEISNKNPNYYITITNKINNNKTGLIDVAFISGLTILVSGCVYMIVRRKQRFV